MAQPLVIDADVRDIRVVETSLGLKNRAAVEEGMSHNRRLREQRRKDAHRELRHTAEVGAEFIHRRSTSTRTTRLEDVVKHYQ